MQEIDENLNKEIINKVYELYNKYDYLSLISFSKTNEVQNLLYHFGSYQSCVRNYENLIGNLRIFILIGIANYNLRRYKKAIFYFNSCLIVLGRISELADLCSLFQNNKESWMYKFLEAFEQLKKNNDFFKPILYAYIAHANFKMHNVFNAYKNYRNAINNLNRLQLTNTAHKDIYIEILLGYTDSYYELTKIYITLIKILVFIVFFSFLILHFSNKIILIYSNLHNIFNPFLVNIFLFFGILTFPKILYKIFYFPLRKIRHFVFINFIKLFPEPFIENLISILNYVNLKKFFLHKSCKKNIENIENIGKQNFNTFFAIAKLYYCLGDYKNSTFYIQRALIHHKEKNKSELAMAYHYLARIAYKTSNNTTAIDLYNKAIENLMNINDQDNDYRIEYLPSIFNMIKYTQENRNKLEQITFSRTYLPLFITLIITIIVCIAQIYYCIPDKNKEILSIFTQIKTHYEKITK